MTKVNVPPGMVVELDKRRTTSVKGGTYDISKLPEADQKRLLATKGVTEVRSSTTKKES